MENRLELNKRIKYELPDEVIIGEYRRNASQIPDFEPDICITKAGCIKVKDKFKTSYQFWVKTDNKDLIEFIRNFDFESKLNKITNAYNFKNWQFKKIILEEFYNKK